LPNLNIQFLDVGQGDGIFITFPNGKTMLVDLGSLKNKKLTSNDVFKYFKTHTKFRVENQELDYLILTHGDRDHYNMVKEFISKCKVTVTNLLYAGDAADYGVLLKGLARNRELRSSRRCPFELNSKEYFGGVEVLVLGFDTPTAKSDEAWRKNTGSVVLRLEYGGQGVILSGDATVETEWHILATMLGEGKLAKMKSTVLKVGHHGSARTSILPKWIQEIKPEFIFISSDRSGSLDDKGKPTGHRLPQQLAIDIIDGNTKLHTEKEGAHTYVSSYDPTDYTDYGETDRATRRKIGFPNPHKEKSWADNRAWMQFTTEKAIYTTLAVMDLRSADASPADQGAQYELIISDAGKVTVNTTLAIDVPPSDED